MYELTIKCESIEQLKELTAKLEGAVETSAPAPAAETKSTRSRKGTAKPVVASNTGSASPVPAPVGANSSQGDGSVPPADTPTPEVGQATAASAGEDVTFTDEDIKVAMEAAAKRVDLNTLRGLLLEHGASRRSELKPENYAAFMAELKGL